MGFGRGGQRAMDPPGFRNLTFSSYNYCKNKLFSYFREGKIKSNHFDPPKIFLTIYDKIHLGPSPAKNPFDRWCRW